MEKKKQFADNKLRSAKIKDKMTSEYGKPVIVFSYFSTMADAKKALGATNAMIYKAEKRSGIVRGFRVITGHDVSRGLTALNDLIDISKKLK